MAAAKKKKKEEEEAEDDEEEKTEVSTANPTVCPKSHNHFYYRMPNKSSPNLCCEYRSIKTEQEFMDKKYKKRGLGSGFGLQKNGSEYFWCQTYHRCPRFGKPARIRIK